MCVYQVSGLKLNEPAESVITAFQLLNIQITVFSGPVCGCSLHIKSQDEVFSNSVALNQFKQPKNDLA